MSDPGSFPTTVRNGTGRTPRFRFAAAALSSAVLLTACSESDSAMRPEWAPPPVAANPSNAQSQFGTESKCMEDVVEALDGSNAVPLNCTANDMNLFLTQPSGGADLPLCMPGDILPDITLDAVVVSTAKERYDIGIWIRDDNLPIADALRGDCRHWSLVPGGGAASAPGATERYAPFYDGDGDTCGDLEQDIRSILTPIVLSGVMCQDTNGDGMLDIGACVAYDNNSNTAAANCEDPNAAIGATRPNTKAKCKCGPVDIPIRIAGRITVEKQTIPDGDGQAFAFTGDLEGSIKDGETISELVEAGTYTATETLPPGWDLTSIVCTDPTSNSSVNLATRTATFNVAAGEEVKCVFTNTKRASIVIKKVTDPVDVGGNFDFTHNVGANSTPAVLSPFSLAHDETQTFLNVVPTESGYTVTESAKVGFDLTSLVCDNPVPGNASTTNIGTRTATVRVDPGETVTCTFTNTQRGSIVIEKITEPAGVGGNFAFTHTVGANSDPAVVSPFNVAHGGNQTFSNVVPTTTGYTVIESAKDGFDLTALTCDNPVAGNASTTSLATRTATVRVDPGETVTCRFTNTQRATVQIVKWENGGLPLTHAWEFQIRKGASLASAGTVIASGTANLATGVVTFSCAGGGNADCTDVGGIANIKPGNYQFCEVNMLPGWANNISGFTPDGSNPEGADNGDECIDITLAAGASGQPAGITAGNVNVDNTPPPGGDARTIGYWKNHSCLARGNQDDVLTTKLPINLGTGDETSALYFDGTECAEVVSLLDKRDISSGKKMASDAAYNLAAQLAAALLNVNSGAGSCPVPTTTINDAKALLSTIGFTGSGGPYLRPNNANYSIANGYAAILDAWNNNSCLP